jgi:hypothetical protein
MRKARGLPLGWHRSGEREDIGFGQPLPFDGTGQRGNVGGRLNPSQGSDPSSIIDQAQLHPQRFDPPRGATVYVRLWQGVTLQRVAAGRSRWTGRDGGGGPPVRDSTGLLFGRSGSRRTHPHIPPTRTFLIVPSQNSIAFFGSCPYNVPVH